MANQLISQIRRIWRFLVVRKYYAMMSFTGTTHFLFCLFFLYYQVWPMMIFNIVSTTMYFSTLLLIKRRKEMLAIMLAYLEIVLHGIAATYCVGWNTGFAQYLFVVVPLGFFACLELTEGSKRFVIPFLLGTLVGILYASTRQLSHMLTPPYTLSHQTVDFAFVVNSVVTFAFLLLFLILYTYTISEMEQKLRDQNAILDYKASVDPLTNLLNRRSMQEHLIKVFESGRDFAVAMLDIDDFKNVNDSYGHEAGDLVLLEVARIVQEIIPEGSPVCRWGGEEILILFIDASKAKATELSEQVRKCIADNYIPFYQKTLHVTVTIGVSAHYGIHSIDETIAEADNKMYYGKKHGKNQVVSLQRRI